MDAVLREVSGAARTFAEAMKLSLFAFSLDIRGPEEDLRLTENTQRQFLR